MGLRGVHASQSLGALELIAQVAVEVGHPARVQVHDRDIPVVRPAGKIAAQHESWKKCKGRQTVIPWERGEDACDPHPRSQSVLRRKDEPLGSPEHWGGWVGRCVGILGTLVDPMMGRLPDWYFSWAPRSSPCLSRDHRFGVKNAFPHLM